MAAGRSIARLFIGGKLYPELAEIQASIQEVSALSDDEVVQALAKETGYAELQSVAPEMAVALARVFRHDSLGANRYLADAGQRWAGTELRAPMTVVVASDDPLTPRYEQAYRRWDAFANVVDLRKVDGGGHYFCRTRADVVARLIADELKVSVRESGHA